MSGKDGAECFGHNRKGLAMLRIHFTGADLMRTRIAGAPDPMWELTLSLHQLRSPSSPVFRQWRRETIKRLGMKGSI